jgi:hypothetical protein
VAFSSIPKRQSPAYGLTFIGVRILAENDHANLVEWAVVEGSEYICLRRVDALAFFSQGIDSRHQIATRSASEYRVPAVVELHPSLSYPASSATPPAADTLCPCQQFPHSLIFLKSIPAPA